MPPFTIGAACPFPPQSDHARIRYSTGRGIGDDAGSGRRGIKAVCADRRLRRALPLARPLLQLRRVDPRYGVAASPRVVEPGEPVPKGGGAYRVGAPYMVAGRVYVPEEDPHYRAEGLASWYGDDFHGR